MDQDREIVIRVKPWNTHVYDLYLATLIELLFQQGQEIELVRHHSKGKRIAEPKDTVHSRLFLLLPFHIFESTGVQAKIIVFGQRFAPKPIVGVFVEDIRGVNFVA